LGPYFTVKFETIRQAAAGIEIINVFDAENDKIISEKEAQIERLKTVLRIVYLQCDTRLLSKQIADEIELLIEAKP